MFENEGMNVLAFCFEALIDFSLLLLSLLDQKFYFVFNYFGLIKEVLILLLSDLILNGNEIWLFDGHSCVKKFHLLGFEVLLSSEENFLFFFDLCFPVLFFLLLFLQIRIFFFSDVGQ